MRPRNHRFDVCLWAILVLASAGAAETAEPAVVGEKRVLRLFPTTELYPPYVADLHRPRFGIARLQASEAGIADSGETRFDLRLGGRFGAIGVHPPGKPERGWQLQIVAGIDAQFDVDHGYDNVGWDGNYGLMLTTAVISPLDPPRGTHSHGLAFKVGALHTSSHIGDELIERTGRQRIGYTREELVAGLSWTFHPSWRVYAEGGWGYDLRNEELQEPGRAQLGLEYERPESFWKGRLGWYAAADASATEERDWRVDVSVQAGVLVRSDGRHWRLGAGHYDGRPPLGEFFQDTEEYFTLGLWLDL